MTLYTTMWQDEPSSFSDGLVVLRRDRQSKWSIARVLWSCEDGDAVLLNGAMGFDERYVDLLLALMIRLRRRRVALVISDATWHARSIRAEARIGRLHGLVERLGKAMLAALVSPHVHICFLSEAERQGFVDDTGAAAENVHFTPFSPSITVDELPALQEVAARTRPPHGPGYVFSGGNSSRDYPLLIEALGGAPYEVRVACSASLPWPANFTVGPVSHDAFLELMAGSAVTVLPLVTSTQRGVGQQTYLNAMLLGVPVVVNDAVGVRDYIDDGVHAVVVPPRDPMAMRAATDRLMATGSPQVSAMAERGRQRAVELGRDRYFLLLKDLLLRAQRRAAAPPEEAVGGG